LKRLHLAVLSLRNSASFLFFSHNKPLALHREMLHHLLWQLLGCEN